MRLHRTYQLATKVSGGLLLPRGRNTIDAHSCLDVSRWLLLSHWHMRPSALQLRSQVPRRLAQADQVPAPFLLPWDAQRQHDAVPGRIQLRRGGHVRADGLLSRDLRVVPGQEVVRPVRRGALLPDRDVVGAVPGGGVLPSGRVGADAVPREPVLPAGVGEAQGLPAGEEGGGGVQVGQRLPLRVPAATALF